MIKNLNRKMYLQLIMLLLLFMVSAAVRWFNLNQPLGRHHEWVSAHTLLTLKIWERGGGPEHFHFSPVYTFQGAMNKHMGIFRGVKDEKGDYYYVSYPPFAFIAPYYAIKLTGGGFTVFNLQLFSLLIHFLSAVLLFFLLLELRNKKLSRDVFIPAWLAYLLYLFSAGNLWFHANVYFVDAFMQMFVFLQLYVYLRIWKSDHVSYRSLLALSLVTFLAIYTEWLGLLIAFCFGIALLVKWMRKRNRNLILVALVLLLFSILSLGATFYQYSSIAGAEQFMEESFRKYNLRSGHAGVEGSEHGFSISNPDSYTYLKEHYTKNYHYTLQMSALLFALTLFLFFFYRKAVHGDVVFLFSVLFCALLLHHLLFFNFNAVHDFSTMKVIAALIILVALFAEYLFGVFDLQQLMVKRALYVLFFFYTAHVVYGNYLSYCEENSLEKLNLYAVNVGQEIQQKASDDEVVYVDSWITPECMYYAERNYYSAPDIQQALGDMRKKGIEKGLFFYTRAGTTVTEVYRIFSAGDSLRLR